MAYNVSERRKSAARFFASAEFGMLGYAHFGFWNYRHWVYN